MRLSFARLLPALSLLAAALAFPSAAAAQVDPSADNAITCASIYRYLGDRGPGYELMAAKNAALTGRSIDAVKADLDQREPRLQAGIADGRLKHEDMVSLAAGACPKTFGVAPASPGITAAARTSPQPVRPDPVQCAGLYRWFDDKYPANAWGTTWAGDEMVRRAASAAGQDYDTMNSRANAFSPATNASGPLLDQAVACQQAYDVSVPPGAVIAAAQNGDRPGIERGRNAWCKALSNDFDSRFPDISSVEYAIAQNPPSGMNRALETLKSLQWYLDSMGKAGCPGGFVDERMDAFEQLSTRATNAVNQAKQRVQREGKWW